ncbi:MAG: histidine--tRNA ligase [Phycisphaerae bacterium]|nr:histidine--tRNA ligase [Phycisphaerae bacterium]
MAEKRKKFQAVKGTRDFYPAEMRVRNYITDAWRAVSLRNGFEEYDAPIFEYLDLFTVKSGDEIASQLFNFTDRGGRNLAIRPEITPSLARMVAAKINSLPRPIKWFAVPRLCRAENPQKGRLREFFQWNVDVIGVDDIQADAECIFVAVDFLREVNLTPDDACVRIGSRPITVAALKTGGLADDQIDTGLALLDKTAKVDADGFAKLVETAGLCVDSLGVAMTLQGTKTIDEIRKIFPARDSALDEEIGRLEQLFVKLEQMGISDYAQLDMTIVRGLAYYTGVVYEVFDRKNSLRALAGGGRYDRLLEVVGGPSVGATGFGMGDVVLGILLQEKDKIPAEVLGSQLDFFVIDGEEDAFCDVMKIVGQLRRDGFAADYAFKRQNVGKQLKEANRRGARLGVIVRKDGVSLKDLQSGGQGDVSVVEFLANPRGVLGGMDKS